MKAYSSSDKLVVRDSLDLSDISEVEDDVFIRDGRTCKTYEDTGLKRPLMAPRRKNFKGHKIIPIMKKRTRFQTCCEPFCYAFVAITILVVLIFLAALILTMFPVPLQKVKVWLRKDLSTFQNSTKNPFSSLFYGSIVSAGSEIELVPCTQINIHKVWSKVIGKLSTEIPVRKADLNGDNIEDIIIGFAIEETAEGEELPKCPSFYTRKDETCLGGVLVMDGSSGATLWQRWTAFQIFSVFCTNDINNDTRIDCVASGRNGVVLAIEGTTGKTLWESSIVSDLAKITLDNLDLYTINVIRDVNDDGVNDIVASHVETNGDTTGSHIELISGADGSRIRKIPAPNREEVFVPIQLVTDMDGTEFLLVLTGGQNTAGGLYKIPLYSMSRPLSRVNFGTMFRNPDSGFIVPAVIVDLNGDHTDDIVVSDFNSTVYAFDGRSYQTLWTYIFHGSESISEIVPGHYDHDNITDFMVKYNAGPGMPLYYYSQTTILSGVNGSSLLDSMIIDAGGPNNQLAGLSISQTFGGDFFLYWQVTCRGVSSPKDPYEFVPLYSALQQSRADVCRLRYNATTVLKLYALARHVQSPGAMIFSSDDLNLKLRDSKATLKPGRLAPIKHPKILHRIQPPQLERVRDMNASSKDVPSTTGAGNTKDDTKGQVLEQEEKRTDADMQRNVNRNDDQDSSSAAVEDVVPKPKPNPEIKFPMDVSGGFAPEPYQFLPTFDEKELAKQYNLKIPFPQLNDNFDDRMFNSDSIDAGLPNEDIPYEDIEYNLKKKQRNRYGNSRGIRSKPNDIPIIQDSSIVKKNLNDRVVNGNRQLPNDRIRPESLWDLELEKEEKERYRLKRSTAGTNGNQQRLNSTNSDVLPAISGTGVLLNPLNKTKSAIDYVFVMNIRESEAFPPLLLKQDIECVEEKLSGYRSLTPADLLMMKQTMLEECLARRHVNNIPPDQKYETQIVVTRLTIECLCSDSLNPSTQKCSELNPLEGQEWSESMGGYKNGAYSSS